MSKKAYRPLRGVRVLAFEIAYSLPAATRTLVELGAEVVRVAAPGRGFGNYISVVDGVFLSKPCIGIDLKNAQGREVARCLVSRADIVCSNFRPPVMGEFGLGPDELRAIKPDLIVLQLSGYGRPGPWSDFPAYGPSVEAAGGMNSLMGRESDPPVRVGSGVFADQLSGRYAALALIAALNHRRRTGEGQYIDLSMYEAIVHLLGREVMRAALTGGAAERRGNRDSRYAPQGVYPCKGEDEWIAITVKDDAQWRALAALLGDARLQNPELATVPGRQDCHDEIDVVISSWTGLHEKNELAALLQSRGVAAGPVRKVSDSMFDPHLAARGVFQTVTHTAPILGFDAHPHPTTPWVAEGRRRHKLTEIRYVGADNYSVLRRWAGLGRKRVETLVAAGALADVGGLPVVERAGPAAPRDRDFGERLGLPPTTEGAGP